MKNYLPVRRNLPKWWLISFVWAAWAQGPEIARNGVLNAASNTPAALIDAAVARGASLTVRGTGFGARPSDTTVKLSGKSGAAALVVVSVDPSTVSVRVPANAPLGPAGLTVTVNGRQSQPYPVHVVSAQFGIYALNGKGWGPGRIQNVDGRQRAPNTVSNAAGFLQTLALSGTGLGNTQKPAVTVGGRPAKVVAARASPDGDEILFQVPANAPEGCFVPIQVHNAGSRPSNTVTAAIHKGGGPCRQPEYFPLAGWSGARFGMVTVTRTVEHGYGLEPVSDEVAAWFGQLPGLDRANAYFLLPPPGICTSEVEVWRGGFVPATLISLLASHTAAKALKAGDELRIDDGRTMRKVPAFRALPGVFDRELSDLMGRADRLLHFISPAVVHVAGKGGPDVGRFSVALSGPSPFEMQGPMGPVERSHSLRLEWTDMGAGRIAIVFANFVDEATGSRGMCYCAGAPGATGLTIPASALAYFPPAGRDTRIALTVTAWPLRPVAFQAPGLDHGLAVSAFMQHLAAGPITSSFRSRN